MRITSFPNHPMPVDFPQACEDKPEEKLMRSDGSIDLDVLQKCTQAIGKRSQDALDALKEILNEIKTPREQKILEIGLVVGAEIGSLLSDIPSFQISMKTDNREDQDPRVMVVMIALNVFMKQLQEVLDEVISFSNPQSGAAMEAGEGTTE